MRSKRSRRFRNLLQNLPPDIKLQAYAAYRLFKDDPYHPGLHFKQVSESQNLYSVRIGKGYRALGLRETDDLIVWLWIGTHAEYDKILSH